VLHCKGPARGLFAHAECIGEGGKAFTVVTQAGGAGALGLDLLISEC
jgi:hypothetical protein